MRTLLSIAALLAAGVARADDPAAATTAPAAPPPPAAGAQAPAAAAGRVLTLDEALQLGLARQPQLRQAQGSAEAARARADQALAPLLPQVSGSAAWQHSSSSLSSAFALPGSSSTTTGALRSGTGDEYSAGLTGKLLVWDFGQTSGRWRAAQAAASGQEQSERATRGSVALGIRAAYFNAVAAKALVGVAQETLANQERHLAQVQGFVDVGSRPQIDLAQARTDVANARVQLIQAENGYAVSRVQVEQAIGVTDLGPWEVAAESPPPVPGEEAAPDVLLAEALRARPELAALADQLRAQDLTVRALQGGYAPSLGVSAGVSEAGPKPSELDSSWNTAVTLTWPLFQGGLTRAQVREARATSSVLDGQLEQERQAVRLEVEQARLAVRAAGATLVASGDAVQNARERLTLAEGRYQTGVGSAIELGDAQTALTTALGQRVQSEFQLAVARSQLVKALGR